METAIALLTLTVLILIVVVLGIAIVDIASTRPVRFLAKLVGATFWAVSDVALFLGALAAVIVIVGSC